jgi:hypothetical protein
VACWSEPLHATRAARRALMQFGDRYHLPPVISGHNVVYIWGPDGCTGQVFITINIAPHDTAHGYDLVTLAAMTSRAACVSFENQVLIPTLRQPKANMPFADLCVKARHDD